MKAAWCAAVCWLLLLLTAEGGAVRQPRRNIDVFRGAMRQTAGKLYRFAALSEAGNNFVLSPFSASQALGMVLAGAKTQTAFEIMRWFSLAKIRSSNNGSPDFNIHNLMRKTLQRGILKTSSDDATFAKMANAAWVSEGLSLLPQYHDDLEASYNTSAFAVDFADADAAARRINGWVAERTENRIEDLIPDGMLTHDTLLVLANTLYFKGTWAVPFADDMLEGEFHLGDGTDVRVDYMTVEETSVKVYSDKLSSMQFIALPYRDTTGRSKYYFVVGLPSAAGQTLSRFDKKAETVFKNMDVVNWRSSSINLHLPIFEVTHRTDLKPLLRKGGVRRMFDARSRRCDLTGMSRDRSLYVSDFVQKAFVQVDQTGTVAAAASAVGVVAYSTPATIKVNRPFFFGIYSAASDSFLFTGKIENPTI